MAVLGKKPVKERFTKMTEPHQYFKLGDVFVYSPVFDPDKEMILEVMPCRDYGYPETDQCSRCCISDYCCVRSNSVGGEFFVPECSDSLRTDGTDVYFKEI